MTEAELDKRVAYIRAMPIRDAKQMITKITTKTPSAQQDEAMRSQWWYHTNDIRAYFRTYGIENRKMAAKLLFLREHLLSFGGYEASIESHDDDIDKLLRRGQLWMADRIHFIGSQYDTCHERALAHWHKTPTVRIPCTGYALTQHGVWEPHIWLVELHPNRNRVLETSNTAHAAFFGFAMTQDEANNYFN